MRAVVACSFASGCEDYGLGGLTATPLRTTLKFGSGTD